MTLNKKRPLSPPGLGTVNGRIATIDEEYAHGLKKAKKKGWDVPRGEQINKQGWVAYWANCHFCEQQKANGDSDPGRPIAPHRSA